MTDEGRGTYVLDGECESCGVDLTFTLTDAKWDDPPANVPIPCPLCGTDCLCTVHLQEPTNDHN